MKRIFAIIVSVSLVLSCCVFGTYAEDVEAQEWDGSTITEPADSDSDGVKEIGTAAEFAWLGANGGSGSYILTNDIILNDMKVSVSEGTATLTTLDGTSITDTSVLAVWDDSSSFSGTLDGNGHTVSGLYNATVVSVGSNSRHAMFASGANATIKNLRLTNVWFEGATYQGSFFAHNQSMDSCKIINCYVENVYLKSNPEVITNASYPSSGGLVGYTNGSGSDLLVSNVAVNNILLDANRTGAFVGDAWASGDFNISNSYNATEYATFGGNNSSKSYYKGTMESNALYSATANTGDTPPAVIVVDAADMVGQNAAESLKGLGSNFYTTASYPMQEIFLGSVDPAVNTKLGLVPEASGITISGSSETYRMTSAPAATPLTWEAVIKVDTAAPDRVGIVVGNYGGTGASTSGMEIRDGGHPSLWISPSKFNFTEIDVRTGEKMHLAIAFDPDNDTATCYVNGVAKQTVEVTKDVPTLTDTLCVGGDLRSGNGQYLKKTEVYSVALYSDARSAEEIAADAAVMDKEDESLIAAYDFTTRGETILADISANNNHLIYSGSKTFETGTTFTNYDRYITTAVPSALPLTVQADIKVEADAPDTRLYTIFGNYNDYNTSNPSGEAFNLEIRENGVPCIYLQKSGNVRQMHKFSDIDLRKEGRVDLVITINFETNTLCCYINGALRQTIVSSSDLIVPEMTKVIGVGRDLRSDEVECHLQYAELFSVSAYSDIRTKEEIEADTRFTDSSDPNMLFAFDLSSDSEDKLNDLSANGNDLVYTDATPSPEGGTVIDSTSYYKSTKILTSFPKTLEAEVYLPRNFDDATRGGVIAGNYGVSSNAIVNFEIYTNGQPRLYLVLPGGTVVNAIFSEVDVRTGLWVDLAIVLDSDADTLTCYIDGVAKQTKSVSDFEVYAPSCELMVGSDYRGVSSTSFAGKINSLALYSDTRSADEIAADAQAVDLTDENLMAAYDLSEGYQKDIEDSSVNDNDLINQGTFYLDEVPELEDYAYSFAVVGDTQIVTRRYPDKLANIYDWILANAENYNIQHVFGMGDITNNDTDTEWEVATTEFKKLDGKLSYSLIRGNHDGIDQFDKYLAGDSPYTAQYDGEFEAGSALNTYQYLTVGTTDYLIFNLDYGFNDEVVAWASEIIEDHPNHNVIITTHAYLYRDGTTLDAGDVCPPSKSGGYNDGDHMWDKLVSKHKNIVLVMSGHDPCAKVVTTQTEGENGNIVTQMLIDPQGLDADSSVGPTGMVTMLYFSEDGKTVQVRNYSTIKEKYYGKQNQYTITVEKITPTMGDANDDAAVNVLDLVTVSNAVLGRETVYNKNTADVNCDGVIDKLDLAEIRKLIIQ